MIMEKQVTQMKADFFSKSYYCVSQVQVTKGCKPLSLVKKKPKTVWLWLLSQGFSKAEIVL